MAPKGVLHQLQRVLLFSLGSTCYALLGIFAELSKAADGSYEYSMSSVVLLAELAKLCMSSCFLCRDLGVAGARDAIAAGTMYTWLSYAVPSVLYSLNNTLDMVNQKHMDPATESVLLQLKILTTSVLWRLVFGKALGLRKWCSLVGLFAGCACAAYPSAISGERTMYIDGTGMVLIVCYATFSAMASVYMEWLYRREEHMHASNIRLYSIGCCFNLCMYLGSGHNFGLDLIKGYNMWTWALVATYASMGLILGYVMKFFDNIVKLFLSGLSVYVSAGLTRAVFGYRPSSLFVVSLVVVTCAVLFYNLERLPPLRRQHID